MSNREWDRVSYNQSAQVNAREAMPHELELTYEYGFEVGRQMNHAVIRRLEDNLADCHMRIRYLERELVKEKASR